MRKHYAEDSRRACSLEERISQWETWAEQEDIAYAHKKSIVHTIRRADDPLHRTYLMGLAESHKNDPRFLVDLFASYTGIKTFPLEKRQSILGYLSRKANRQLVKQLSTLKRLPRTLNDYVACVDELPSVGRRGQIRLLIKIANLQGFKKDNRSRVWRDLQGIVKQGIDAPPGMRNIIELLHRHDDLPAEEILSQFFTYFQLSARKPKLGWLKKENYRLGQQDGAEEPPRKWLNRTGKRKLREELERKLRITRFEAFKDAVNKAYYCPLTAIVGQELPARFFMSPELLKVVSAYGTMSRWNTQTVGDAELFKSAEEELRPLIKDLLRAYINGVDAAVEHLASLPGNKALGEKLGAAVLKRWREGYAKSFEIGRAMDCPPQYAPAVPGGYCGYQRAAHPDNLPCECEDQGIMDFGPMEVNDFGEAYEDCIAAGPAQNRSAMPRLAEEGEDEQENARKRIRFYDAKDPIEAMQMGETSDTCTHLNGGDYAFAAFVNAIDGNKKVVYMADMNGKRIGRTLCVLARKGLIAYDFYTQDTAWEYNPAWVEYFSGFAKKLGVPLIVVDKEAQLEDLLEQAGAKNRNNLRIIIDHAICGHWYDNAGQGQVKIPKRGLSVDYTALVLPLKKNKVKV